MSRIALGGLLGFFALTALAQDPAPAPRDPHLEMVASDLHALGRITALSEDLDRSRQVLLAIIDNDVQTLRDPRDDGTYRWASLQREEGGRVTDEKNIEYVYTQDELRYVTLTAPNTYRMVVTIPRKRGTFSANNRVWIRNVIVEATGFDGRVSHHEIPVNAWVSPGDAHGVAFPEIGKSVKATAELGVESGDKQAVAEVALVQAKLVDDPNSPYYPAVKRLLQIRELAGERSINRGTLRNAIDEALLSLPGELEKRTAEHARAVEERRLMAERGEMRHLIRVGDATPDVVQELTEISILLTGNLDEQRQARERLQSVIDRLRPAPLAATSR